MTLLHELTTEDAALLRQAPTNVERYLSYAPATTLFTGVVTVVTRDAANLNVVSLTLGTLTGDLDDVLPGMSAWVGTTSGGRDVGSVRVRKAVVDHGVTATLPIAETALGQLHVEVGHHVTVKALRRPYAKVPRLTAITGDSGYTEDFNEYHDYDETYTDQNTKIAPVANVTRDGYLPFIHAGWVDLDLVYHTPLDYRTLTLDALTSYPITGSIVSYLWGVDDSVFVDATSSSTPLATVQATVGFHWFSLTVTTSEGKVKTRWFPVWVHDDSYPPILEARFTRDERSEWRELEVELPWFTQADVVDISPDAVLSAWEVATYDGDPAPAQRVRETLGWAPKGVVKNRTDASTWQLTIVGSGGWLNALTGFGQVLLRPTTTATRWSEMESQTENKVLHYLLREYSTILDLTNLYLPAVFDPVEEEELKPSTQWQQLVYLCSAYQGAAGCSSDGTIWVQEQPFYVDEPADLVDWPVVLNLTPADWTFASGFDLALDHQGKVAQLSMGGSYYDGTPDENGVLSRQLLAVAPGDAPTGMGSNSEGPYQRLPNTGSQDELNRRVGREWARQNSRFQHVTLELVDDFDVVEVAWRALVLLTSYEPGPYGPALDHMPFVVTQVTVAHGYDKGTPARVVTLDLEAVVVGDDGTTVPVLNRTPPVDYPPPPPVIPPSEPGPGGFPPDDGVLPTNGVCLSYGEGAAALITGLSGGSLIFDPWTTGITGSRFFDGCSNPFAYKQLLGVSDAGVEYCPDQSAKAGFSLLKSNAELFGGAYIGHRIRATINFNGCFLVASGSNCLAQTLDKFGTVSTININGLTLTPSASDADDASCDICPVERSAGVWYATAPNSGDSSALGLYRSTNNGASWSLVSSMFDSQPLWYAHWARTWLEIPYTRIDGSPNVDDASLELWFYMAGDTHTGAVNYIIVSRDRGLTASVANQWGSPNGGRQEPGARSTHPVSTFTYGLGYAYFLNGLYASSTPDGLVTTNIDIHSVGSLVGETSVNGWSSNPLPFIMFSKEAATPMAVSLDGATAVTGLPAGWTGGIAMAEFSLWPILA